MPSQCLEHADLISCVWLDIDDAVGASSGHQESDSVDITRNQHSRKLPDAGALFERPNISAVERKEVEDFLENLLKRQAFGNQILAASEHFREKAVTFGRIVVVGETIQGDLARTVEINKIMHR